jgi:hypothetical protein
LEYLFLLEVCHFNLNISNISKGEDTSGKNLEPRCARGGYKELTKENDAVGKRNDREWGGERCLEGRVYRRNQG